MKYSSIVSVVVLVLHGVVDWRLQAWFAPLASCFHVRYLFNSVRVPSVEDFSVDGIENNVSLKFAQ